MFIQRKLILPYIFGSFVSEVWLPPGREFRGNSRYAGGGQGVEMKLSVVGIPETFDTRRVVVPVKLTWADMDILIDLFR